MESFFELLQSRSLGLDSAVDSIRRLSKTKLLDFVEEAENTLPYVKDSTPSSYGFLANTSLSGAPSPCGMPGCRVARANDLACFAALYADQVLIRDPFNGYHKTAPIEGLRLRLVGAVAVLHELRPLFEAGYVGVAASRFAYCDEHAREALDRAEDLKERFAPAQEWLESYLLDNVRFEYDRETYHVGLSADEAILPHGKCFVGPFDPEVALTSKGRVRKDIRKLALTSLIHPIVNDLFLQEQYATDYAYNYLTDSPLESDVISSITGSSFGTISPALVTGLQHVLPVVEHADLPALIRLRTSEDEAFRVYRDSMKDLLRNADLSSADHIREAFDDVIRPELNRIDLVVKNSRKLLRRSLSRDVTVHGGIVTIGLLLGAIQPVAGAVLASVGGSSVLKDIGKTLLEGRAEPPAARESSFYFLWRVRNEVAGRQHDPLRS